MDIQTQLASFLTSLNEYEPAARVDKQLGSVFNVLLEAAKAQAGDNLVVAAIQPAGVSSTGNCSLTAGELRTLTRQLLAAV